MRKVFSNGTEGTSIKQVLGNVRGFEELQESEVGQKIAQPERFLV